MREALLLSDAEGSPASGLLEQALRSRPGDVGLRELYERLAPEPPPDRATWRMERAREATGAEQARLALEAAFDFERARDFTRVAEAAQIAMAAGEGELAPILSYRAAVAGAGASDAIDALMPKARETEDKHARLEIYERLAELDESGRCEPGCGMRWRRPILVEVPDHLPTLRRLASALVSAGRDEELEGPSRSTSRAPSTAPSPSPTRCSPRACAFERRVGMTRGPPSTSRTRRTTRARSWSAPADGGAHARAKGEHELALEV